MGGVMTCLFLIFLSSCAATQPPSEGKAAAQWEPTAKAKKSVNEALLVCNKIVFVTQAAFDECMGIEGYQRKTESK